MAMPTWWVLGGYDVTPFDTWSPVDGIVLTSGVGPRPTMGPSQKYDVRDQATDNAYSTLKSYALFADSSESEHPAESAGLLTAAVPFLEFHPMNSTAGIASLSLMYGYTDRTTGRVVPLLLRTHGRFDTLVVFARKRLASLGARPPAAAMWRTSDAKRGITGVKRRPRGFFPSGGDFRRQWRGPMGNGDAVAPLPKPRIRYPSVR